MSASGEPEGPWAGGALGFLLRAWRRRRGISQRALAERVGLSVKHLSFLETGRAQPTRASLGWIATALDLTPAEAVQLHETAGFAGDVPHDSDADALGAHRDDVEQTLRLLPSPALVHDRLGTVLAMNDALRALLARFLDLDAAAGPSAGHAVLTALAPHVENADELVTFYRQRVLSARLMHNATDPALATLDESLGSPPSRPSSPARCGVELRLRTPGGGALDRYWLVTSTLGVPQDITLRNLRLVQVLAMPPDTPRLSIAKRDSATG